MEVVFLEPPYHCDLMECSASAVPESSTGTPQLCCITSLSLQTNHRVILKSRLNASCDKNTVVASSWIPQVLQNKCQTQWLSTPSAMSNNTFKLRYIAHTSHLNWDEISFSAGFLHPQAVHTSWPRSLDVHITTLMIQRLLPQRLPCMQNSLVAVQIFDMTMVA